MGEPVQISVTTGTNTNKLGKTMLDVGMLNKYGGLSMRDLNIHVTGALDQQVSKVSSSSAGDRAGNYLGYWFARNITAPEGSVLFVRYVIKRSADPLPKDLTLALVLDPTAPWIEMEFPIATDSFSTLKVIPIAGRLRIAEFPEVTNVMDQIKEDDIPSIMVKAADLYAAIGEDTLVTHWDALMRGEEGEWQQAFNVVLNSGAVSVRLKKVLAARKPKKARETTQKKTVKSATGTKITIARKKRRIVL